MTHPKKPKPRFINSSQNMEFLGISSDKKCDLYFFHQTYSEDAKYIVGIFEDGDSVCGRFFDSNKYIKEGYSLYIKNKTL